MSISILLKNDSFIRNVISSENLFCIGTSSISLIELDNSICNLDEWVNHISFRDHLKMVRSHNSPKKIHCKKCLQKSIFFHWLNVRVEIMHRTWFVSMLKWLCERVDNLHGYAFAFALNVKCSAMKNVQYTMCILIVAIKFVDAAAEIGICMKITFNCTDYMHKRKTNLKSTKRKLLHIATNLKRYHSQ